MATTFHTAYDTINIVKTMKPKRLHVGDKVAIIAPSDTITDHKEELESACENFSHATKLETVLAPDVLAGHYYPAGTAIERLSNMNWALANPEIKAIVLATGGDTGVELVAGLDYDLIKKNPKVIAGVPEASSPLNAITAKTGLITFLGFNLFSYARYRTNIQTDTVKEILFDGMLQTFKQERSWKSLIGLSSHDFRLQVIKPGAASGKIVGGDFTTTSDLHGTPFLQDLENNILVIESSQKTAKNVREHLEKLKVWGVLDALSGIIMHYQPTTHDVKETISDTTLRELVLDATRAYDLPIMQISRTGGSVKSLMLPLGAKANIDTGELTFEITEPTVE